MVPTSAATPPIVVAARCASSQSAHQALSRPGTGRLRKAADRRVAVQAEVAGSPEVSEDLPRPEQVPDRHQPGEGRTDATQSRRRHRQVCHIGEGLVLPADHQHVGGAQAQADQPGGHERKEPDEQQPSHDRLRNSQGVDGSVQTLGVDRGDPPRLRGRSARCGELADERDPGDEHGEGDGAGERLQRTEGDRCAGVGRAGRQNDHGRGRYASAAPHRADYRPDRDEIVIRGQRNRSMTSGGPSAA